VSFIAIGFTIGGGIFVFTGIVLKIVGPALPLAYAFAAIPVFISMLPLAMLGSAIPATGGNYKYPSRMVSPGLAFVGIWTYALASFVGQLPLYALACGNYAQVFLPDISTQVFAILILTLFFIINVLGVRFAAQVQGLMVIILIVALLIYSGKGLSIIHPEYFNDILQKGPGNLSLGIALLTFTYLGSNGIIELGGEIKRPGKTIPQAIFIAFPIITIIYVLIATATVGTLSPQALVKTCEPLIEACRCSLGQFGFIFFIVGGAIVAITTTLNALFIVGTKSLLAIIDDGILPNQLGRLHKKFGTPYVLLTIIWLLSILGVLSGFSLETFASYAALGGMIIFFPVLIASIMLPRRFPEQYEKSEFKLRGIFLWICPVVGSLMTIFFSIIILIDLKSPVKILLFLAFIFSGILFYMARKRSLLKRGINLDDITQQKDWIE
jgi:APA family basic amino acid/polyamine antiporter